MAYYAYAPSYSDIYWIQSPNAAVIARFNGLVTDPNWCGMLTEVAGLESPDVRESAEELVEADGGTHGNFWLGRRPIILTGTTYGHATIAQRNAKLDKIMRATQAFRGDSELHILPGDGGPELMTWVRRQQPVKFSEGWNKTFQIPLVSQYARMYSAALHTITQAFNTNVVIENQGSYPSLPALLITGPVTNPVVTNSTNSKVVRFIAGAAVAATQVITVDTVAHTATSNNLALTGTTTNTSPTVTALSTTVNLAVGMSVTGAGIPAGTTIKTIDSGTQITLTANATASASPSLTFSGDWTANIDFLLTTWPTVDTGNNTFILTGTGNTVATQLQINWRDTWV